MSVYDTLRSDQRDAVDTILRLNGRCPVFSETRVGKALALDTPLPTPTGWTTMAAVAVGDRLIGSDGLPCLVTYTSPVFNDRTLCRVTFSDGSHIDADAQHEWCVEVRSNGGRRTPAVLTTADLVAGGVKHRTGQNNYNRYRVKSVPLLQLPDAELPIAPYVLGAWLGDGHSASSELTCDDAGIVARIATHYPGIHKTKPALRYSITGLSSQLRQLKLMHNKHIPDQYLRSSVTQRIELLQGLMDTDGHVAPQNKMCEISSKFKHLAHNIRDLLSSLGIRSTLRTEPSTLYGKVCGLRHRVYFGLPAAFPVFALERKLRVQPTRTKTAAVRRNYLHITNIVPIESRPVRCLSVATADHLFLAGETMIPTHNTRASLAAAEKLGVNRMLVLGLDVYFEAWEFELRKLAEAGHPFHLPFIRLSSGSRMDERAKQLNDLRKSGRPAMVGINYEAWWQPKLRAAVKAWEPDLIVPDECHRLMDRGGRSARFMHWIANDSSWYKYSIPLTATWQEGGYEDVFSIFKGCNPEVFGNDWASFKDRYLLMKGEWGWKKHVVKGYQNLDELTAKVRANSFHMTQKAVGIPAPYNVRIPVKLTPASMKQYHTFMKEYVHTFDSQLKHASLKVVADIKLTILMKARELTSGWVKDQDGNILDISREKLDAALEIINNETRQGHQVCIWAGFNHDIERLALELKVPLSRTWSTLGSPNEKEQSKLRAETFREFHAGELPVLIGLDKLAKESLDFSPAKKFIFYSTGPSYIIHKQLAGRGQGQGKFPENIMLWCPGTVDEDQLSSLDRKESLAAHVWTPERLRYTTGLEGHALADALGIFAAESDDWADFIHTGQ